MATRKLGLEFVYTPMFEAAARGLLDDEVMRQVEMSLLAEPRAGEVVPGSGGVGKLRVALPGRGKRGGARLVYLLVQVREKVYFLLAYAKNERVDISPDQKRALRLMAKRLEELG